MLGRWDKEPNGCYDTCRSAARYVNECDVGSTRREGQLDIHRAGFRNRFECIYNFCYVVYSSNDSYMYASIFWNCRKTLFMRQERVDDIPKLLEFFQRCKRANEYFCWVAQTDKKHES
jgi:hypothetical protein